MLSLNRWGLVAALAGMLVVGCGNPAPYPGVGTVANSAGSSANLFARDAQVGAETNMMNLNAYGELDDLTDEDIASLGGEDASAEADRAVQAAKVKSLTKCGFLRSNTDGKFFLQVTKGFLWWKRESSIPLSPSNENTGLKIAAALNKKVLLRGPAQGETILVNKVCRLLDFGQVWDLLSKGSLGGKVYDGRTKVGLAHAYVTVKSFATGRMWRATTEVDGSYNVGRLDAGEYEISAKSADYTLGAKDKVTVKKRSKAQAHLGLQPEGQVVTAPPAPPAPPVNTK